MGDFEKGRENNSFEKFGLELGRGSLDISIRKPLCL